MLDWMDRNGYPPPANKDLPDHLLGHLAATLEVSPQTIRRRLQKAEDILGGLSLTLS